MSCAKVKRSRRLQKLLLWLRGSKFLTWFFLLLLQGGSDLSLVHEFYIYIKIYKRVSSFSQTLRWFLTCMCCIVLFLSLLLLTSVLLLFIKTSFHGNLFLTCEPFISVNEEWCVWGSRTGRIRPHSSLLKIARSQVYRGRWSLTRINGNKFS